ncbi:MAG: hypothetical protein V4654_02540 [Bdellovibrionota bacterium]
MKKLLILSVLLTTFTALQSNATDLEMLYRCSEDVRLLRDESELAVSIYREKSNGKLHAFIEELYTTETQCWPIDPGSSQSPMDCEYEVLSSDIDSFQVTSSNAPEKLIFENHVEKFKLEITNPSNDKSLGVLNWDKSNLKFYCSEIK